MNKSIVLGILLLIAGSTQAECNRHVTDNNHILIDPGAEKQLESIGFKRQEIIESLKATSIPEAHGCWSSASGNFDGQLLSIGIAQWNYGQKSLQPLLRRYKDSYKEIQIFESEIARLMPTYGATIFSKGCLRDDLTKDCEDFLKSVQILRDGKPTGKLKDDFSSEMNALFESDLMTQIQADNYVKILTSVTSDLKRLFPKKTPSPLQTKWAIDTKVQQGGFPDNKDLNRIRDKIRNLPSDRSKGALYAVLKWYEGLCEGIDQQGTEYDCEHNKTAWPRLIESGKNDPDTLELILFSHLRSRIAKAESGLYQANTFQRRAKIIFGGGSVHGYVN